MQTCQSPWTVMQVAHEMAACVLPDHASRFSRHDFTLAQLFACLVVREQLNLSFRKIEAVLLDTDWCQQLGMTRVPDHSTLFRAFKHLVGLTNTARMLDVMVEHERRHHRLGRTLAIDSTLYDTHHRSRHYERRCRHHAETGRKSADSRRSAAARRTPKLVIGVDTRSHLILSIKAETGMGSDAPDSGGLLYDAWRRHRVRQVLATRLSSPKSDATRLRSSEPGYDSEANHTIARHDLNIRSLIKPGIGRPTAKRAAGRYRRRMQTELAGSQAARPYGKRAQVETVMSMLKRNLGDSLRSRSTARRKCELMMKVLVHNVMIIRRRGGSQQSRTYLFYQFKRYAPFQRPARAGYITPSRDFV